jgi:hypothetical protein
MKFGTQLDENILQVVTEPDFQNSISDQRYLSSKRPRNAKSMGDFSSIYRKFVPRDFFFPIPSIDMKFGTQLDENILQVVTKPDFQNFNFDPRYLSLKFNTCCVARWHLLAKRRTTVSIRAVLHAAIC